MKILVVIIFLVHSQLWANESRAKDYSLPLDRLQAAYNTIEKTAFRNKQKMNFLQKVKFYIINGNLNYAKTLLREAEITEGFSKDIQLRYLASIEFLLGNYKNVIKLLNYPELKDFTKQSHVCLMKVMSALILDRLDTAKADWEKCKSAGNKYSKNSMAWIDVLTNLKLSKDKNFIEKQFSRNPIDSLPKVYLSLYLKLALYLNQSNKIIPRFKYFSKDILEQETYRELIGLNYFRNGNIYKAYQFLNNLSTPTAEIFKAQIYLFQRKYELAYAQYKVALKQKNNSYNALERLLPLAWKLKQPGDGIEFVQKIETTKDNEIENLTLFAAFLSMSKEYESAYKLLQKIEYKSHKGSPIEVSQLMVLNLMKNEKFNKIPLYSSQNCMAKNGFYCWFLSSISQWEGILSNKDNNAPIHSGVSLVNKLTKEIISNPIKEKVIVDPKKIEQLDNDLIELISLK